MSIKDSLEVYLKAINGEDISSPSDIDKEIALFKLGLNVTDESVKERNSELMVKVAYEIFSHLKSKLDKLAYLFQSKQEVLRTKTGGSAVVINREFEKLELFKKAFEKFINNQNSVSYLYQLQRDLHTNKNNVTGEVQINFLNKTYVVAFRNDSVTKLYGEKIIDQKMVKFIELVVRFYMKSIKSLYN